MPPAPRAPVARVSSQTRLTAVIVACAFFMQNLDSTVIATALPTMARAFDIDPVRMNVALTAYLLSVAVFIPASGWMADRYGTRNVFRAAIIVFTLGSIWCGLSNGLFELVVARIVQGMGGAMMVPVGRLLLLRTAAKTEMVAAMAWLTMPALLGPVVGPPVGGFIVTWFNWRWTFYINIPVGILGLVAVTLFIKDFREQPRGGFDLRGLILSGAALACFMFGLETVGRGVVAPPLTVAMIVAGLAAAFLYYLHARRHPAPLLDFTLMRLPCFGLSFCAMMLFRTGIGAIPFLLPMMLQVGFGDSAARSGLITFASSAGALVMKPAAQHALRLFGFRDTLIWNGVLSGIMLIACAAFRPTWPAAAIYFVLLVGGFLRSLQFTAYNTLAYGDVPRAQMSAATSLYTAGQQLAATIGITAGAISLEVARVFSGHAEPMISDFSAAFVVVGLMALVAAPIAVLMPLNAGDDLTGRHTPVPAPREAARRAGE
ncbi:MFS transporter [Rhodopila sp.]|uniref:MFS transporter n=1 Tax=Rhodopila sp. TaxID=2480087 RepID=UPI002BB728BA|nr:MFS transporter [Rhodopila sp.]HVZ10658.1 MFS transporter [Rhodopila sp.]